MQCTKYEMENKNEINKANISNAEIFICLEKHFLYIAREMW